MSLTKYLLGSLLERNTEINTQNAFGLSCVRGVTNSKKISNTKVDVSYRDLSKFLVVRPGGFVFNHRVHDKLGLGYNTTNDTFNFEYGNDVIADGIKVNDKCRMLAKKIKEIIDTKSSFADWLNNQIIRDQLKFDIKVCLIKNGYPPQYSPEVFRKVMEQVENFEENS